MELSRRELARATRLVDQGWTPQRNHDTAIANSDRARAALAQAEAVAAAAREQLAVLDSETRQIDARLAEARANLQLAEIALADTVIRAPVAGVVGNRLSMRASMCCPAPPFSRWCRSTPSGWWRTSRRPRSPAWRSASRSRSASTPISDAVIRGTGRQPGARQRRRLRLLPPDNATGNFVKIVQRVPVKITLPAGHGLLGRLVPGLSVDVAVEVGPSPGTAAAAEGGPSQVDARIFRTADDAS